MTGAGHGFAGNASAAHPRPRAAAGRRVGAMGGRHRRDRSRHGASRRRARQLGAGSAAGPHAAQDAGAVVSRRAGDDDLSVRPSRRESRPAGRGGRIDLDGGPARQGRGPVPRHRRQWLCPAEDVRTPWPPALAGPGARLRDARDGDKAIGMAAKIRPAPAFAVDRRPGCCLLRVGGPASRATTRYPTSTRPASSAFARQPHARSATGVMERSGHGVATRVGGRVRSCSMDRGGCCRPSAPLPDWARRWAGRD